MNNKGMKQENTIILIKMSMNENYFHYITNEVVLQKLFILIVGKGAGSSRDFHRSSKSDSNGKSNIYIQ